MVHAFYDGQGSQARGPEQYLREKQLHPQVGLQAAVPVVMTALVLLPPNQNEHFLSCDAPLAAPRTLAGSGR